MGGSLHENLNRDVVPGRWALDKPSKKKTKIEEKTYRQSIADFMQLRSKIKDKATPLLNCHAMKTYGGVEVQLHLIR
jgi:hypothetical protein